MALLTFTLSLNEYLYGLVQISKDENETPPPGVIATLAGGFNIERAMVMAASVLMSVPVILVFTFQQRHRTRGFGAGAVKE